MTGELKNGKQVEAIDKMVQEKTFNQPLLFFHWANNYGETNFKNANILEINHFCVLVCDRISGVENSGQIFKGIISQAEFMCVKSKVNTTDLRVKAMFYLISFMGKFADNSST